MELLQEYKQTEIGLLPSDWDVKSLGEIGKFSKGQGIRKDDALSGDIPCIRYGEIYTRHNDYVKRFYSFISKEISLTSKRLKKGDILFAGSGETKAEIGKNIAFMDDMEVYAGSDIVIFTPFKQSSIFLSFLLNTPFIQSQKASRGQGDAVVHISANQLGQILIPIPNLNEQTLIATALLNTDNWITNLENLLAKKRQIKQGALNDLLKPREDWVIKKFNELCWFQEGPGLRNWQFTKSGIKVINVTNLEGGILNLERTSRHISLSEFHKMYEHFEIEENDIVVASSGNSYGKVAVVRKQDLPLVMNTSVIRFKPLKELDYNYLLTFLKSKSFKNQIDLLITGGAQPNFGPVHLNKIEINLPASKNEQIRIATALTDMDAEIEQLETKLEKAKKVKQGMLQELLTGKTRLV